MSMEAKFLLEGKYEIVKKIGHGSTSTVYLSKNTVIDYLCAIKIISKNSYSYSQSINEAKILKQLSHPSLPRIIDIFEDTEKYYIVMDYIEGMCLTDIIKQRKHINEDTAKKWLIQIGEVISYLHGIKPEPLIYRDLKPSNIIIDNNDNVRIIDFGAVREYKESSDDDTLYIGTRGFSAPEQFEYGQTNKKTDIYNFGMTAFTMLTGVYPNSISHKRINFELKSRGISNELIKVIKKCIEDKPENRYETMPICLEAIKSIGVKRIKTRYIYKGKVRIAVTGITKGIGVTHTCIAISNALSNITNDVAIYEANNSNDFEKLHYNYFGKRKSFVEKYFEINGIRYYKNNDSQHLIPNNHEVVIYDLSNYNSNNRISEFLRSDYKLILCPACDWKINLIEDFLNTFDKSLEPSKWNYIFPFVDKKDIENIKSIFSLKNVYSFPLCVDPFKLNKDNANCISYIMKKIIYN